MKKLVIFTFWFIDVSLALAQTPLNQIDDKGLKQGKWQKENDKHEIVYIGQFKDDKPYGTFQYLYPKGKLKSEVIHKNEHEVYTTNFYENKKIMAQGKFFDKKKDSTWTYYSNEGVIISIENYNKDVKHGIWKNYYSDGIILQELNWKNGLKDGQLVNYYPNGKPKMEAIYIKNKLTGAVKHYNDNGKVYIHGAYKNDLKDSWWYYFDEKGAIVDKEKYVKGVLIVGEKKNKTIDEKRDSPNKYNPEYEKKELMKYE